ncbi:MAG: chemotaxis protein CheC [Desulfotomaculum sp.]|nr:chemotaxis protein CheC [Desulfotomaculum sp.]
MGDSVDNKLSDTYMDVLKEIGNIGIGNAATSLAQMLDKRIDMEVPQTKFVTLEEAMNLVGGLEETVACATLRIEGDIPGQILFVFNEKSALHLVDMLMGLEKGSTKQLDDMGESAVKEVANVLTGSFLNAISSMTQLNMVPTVPILAYDMLGAVLSTSLIAGGYIEENILMIETVLFEKQDYIKGHFFLITEELSLEKLFKALGLTMN